MAAMVTMSELPPGAVEKEDGSVVFPATQRPDGTWRKERPIRQLANGKYHVPQDEVAAFQTRASRQRGSKPAHPPGYAPSPVPGDAGAGKSASARKNEARKARKRAQQAAEGESEPPTEGVAALSLDGAPTAAVQSSEATPQDALAKKIKGLNKKLKQVAELAAKVDGGFEPNAEQQEKLGRRAGWEAELKQAEAELAAL